MTKLYREKPPEKMDLVVELGSGNGQTLVDLANRNIDENVQFMGIEYNLSLYEKSCSLLTKENNNLTFVNNDFEYVISEFQNESISMFLSILPHPNYIGKESEVKWKSFYKLMLSKMKRYGQFLLITEYTNEMLSVVSVKEYAKWRKWIIFTFEALGFNMNVAVDHAPHGFLSYYLSQFSNDTDRIKILTLLMGK